MKKIDKGHFERFLAFTFDPSAGCMEFSVRDASISRSNCIEKAEKYRRTLGGWFDDPRRLKSNAHRLDGISGYVTINPVKPELLARAANKVVTIKRGEGT